MADIGFACLALFFVYGSLSFILADPDDNDDLHTTYSSILFLPNAHPHWTRFASSSLFDGVE